MPTITILTAKPLGDQYGSKSTEVLCDMCADCKFAEAWKRDDRERFEKGQWKQAMLKAADAGDPNEIQKENVNDWLRHVSCLILPKATELFHVTSVSDWVRRSVVGGNKLNSYSFFTLKKYGFASVHGNQFEGRIQMRLMADLHGFFVPSYTHLNIYKWESQFVSQKTTKHEQDGAWETGTEIGRRQGSNPGETLVEVLGKQGQKETQLYRDQITRTKPDKGAGLVRAIGEAWPDGYRPTFMVGCSECELIIHNSIVNDESRMKTTAIATSKSHFAKKDATGTPLDRKIVGMGDLPVSSGEAANVGFDDAPGWMGPTKASSKRLKKIQKALSTNRLTDIQYQDLFQA